MTYLFFVLSRILKVGHYRTDWVLSVWYIAVAGFFSISLPCKISASAPLRAVVLTCLWSHYTAQNEFRREPGSANSYSVSNALYYAVLCVLESPGYLAWHMDTLKRALTGHCFVRCQTNIFSCTAVGVQLPNSEMRDSEHHHNQVWYICLWIDFYQWKQLQLAFN